MEKKKEINYESLAAMMCGQKLSREQEADVKAFQDAYDKKLSELSKKRTVSVQVNEAMYQRYTTINRHLGVSNNSATNMLIADYVEKHKELL